MASPQVDTQSAIRGFPPSTHRFSAASGLAFVALLLVSQAAYGLDFPTYDDSGREFAAFYADNADAVKLSEFCGALAALSLAWFAGFMRWVFQRAENAARGHARATDIGFGAAIAAVAATVVTIATHATAAVVPGTVEPGVIRALDLLGDYAFVIAGLLLAVWLLTAFFVIRVTNVFDNWLAWLAAVGAVLGILQATLLLAPQDDDGVLGVLGLIYIVVVLVWTATASITLARRPEPVAATR